MPDLKGSTATPATSPLDGTERLLGSDAGVDVVVLIRQVGAYVGGAIRNQQQVGQSPGAGATTYLTGSSLLIPAGERVKATTWARFKGFVTKTAAGTAASSILVKWGINGSTADATLSTLTIPAGTAVIDLGEFEILVGFKSIGAGTAAVLRSNLIFDHNLTTTGLTNLQHLAVAGTDSSGFNSDVDASILGLAFTSGASVVWTFTHLTAELYNV